MRYWDKFDKYGFEIVIVLFCLTSILNGQLGFYFLNLLYVMWRSHCYVYVYSDALIHLSLYSELIARFSVLFSLV